MPRPVFDPSSLLSESAVVLHSNAANNMRHWTPFNHSNNTSGYAYQDMPMAMSLKTYATPPYLEAFTLLGRLQ